MPATSLALREPCARLVALGASNLTRGCASLIDCARQQAEGPIEVLAALGFGRSFGQHSRVLGRTLPGIDGCGLWEALAAGSHLPGTGVVMDVGNDLLYGVDVPVILGWIERALARLRPRVDRLVVVGLPLDNLRRLGPVRYMLFRSLLFPACHTKLPVMRELAERLDDGLEAVAARYDAESVRLSPEWYGSLDPIHFRRRFWPAASRALLGAAMPPASGRARRRARQLRLLFAPPALRWLFGVERRAAQPAVRWPDGTTVSIW